MYTVIALISAPLTYIEHCTLGHCGRWSTLVVVHVCSTCPSSSKQLTVVHFVHDFHSFTQLRCTMHCHFCAKLCARTLYTVSALNNPRITTVYTETAQAGAGDARFE